ncbi:MAG: proton-conducting transporter membrane subunit, partial [Acidobacteriota bacterium]
MNTFMLLLIMIAIWLLGAATSLACWRRDRVASLVSFLTAALGAMFGLTCSISLLLNGTVIEQVLPSTLPLMRFSLRLDSLGAFFLFILSLVALATSIFSLGYVKEYFGRKRVAALGALFNLFLVSMSLVLVANNILTFLIVWELMSIISGLLVIFEHERAETQRAGYLYIVMTHIGTAMLTVSL